MNCAFGLLLYEKIKKCGYSVPDFADAIGTTKGTLSKMSNGRPPSMELVEKIAVKLKLTGKERQKFLDLAAIVHLPKGSQARFVLMRERLEAIENTLDAI